MAVRLLLVNIYVDTVCYIARYSLSRQLKLLIDPPCPVDCIGRRQKKSRLPMGNGFFYLRPDFDFLRALQLYLKLFDHTCEFLG